MNPGLGRDPVLPQLATVIDCGRMMEVFNAMVETQGRQVLACSLERGKYRPGRSASLTYRLLIAGPQDDAAFEQIVAARVCPVGGAASRWSRALQKGAQASAAGPSIALAAALDLVTWWWPNDARLAAPRLLEDETAMRAHIVPALLESMALGATEWGEPQLQVVQYVPEQRLTVRLDLHARAGERRLSVSAFGKAAPSGQSANAHARLQALHACPPVQQGRLRAPRALSCHPEVDLAWQSAVAGETWLDMASPASPTLASALGAQLAALHGCVMTLPQGADDAALRQQLAQVSAGLCLALPDQTPIVERLLSPLADSLASLADHPVVTLHGDLHPRNVLVHRGAPTLIDFDGMRCGAAVLELGAWIADGVLRARLAGRAPLHEAAQWQAFLAGYLKAGGTSPGWRALAWSVGWNLVMTRAWRCLVNMKQGRVALVPDLLEDARHWLGPQGRRLARELL